MANIMTIDNVRSYIAKDGNAWLNAEDVARGWGFVDEKNGVEYIRWNRINSYLKEFLFSLQVAKDDFLPDAQGSNPTLWNPSKHEQCRWMLS